MATAKGDGGQANGYAGVRELEGAIVRRSLNGRPDAVSQLEGVGMAQLLGTEGMHS